MGFISYVIGTTVAVAIAVGVFFGWVGIGNWLDSLNAPDWVLNGWGIFGFIILVSSTAWAWDTRKSEK